MFSKKDENHSAEYHYKSAEGHKKILKAQGKIFLQSGVFVAAALIGIIALSTAWFANNVKVGANGVSVSARNDTLFELATLKDSSWQGVFDDNTESDANLAAALEQNYRGTFSAFQDLPNLSVGSSEYVYDEKNYIIGDSDGISLMVNDTDHLNNAEANRLMGPGSKGRFTFYIIPKKDDLTAAAISISPDGYTIEAADTANTGKAVRLSEATSGVDAETKNGLLNCIQGHLLLFRGVDSSGNYTEQIVPSLSPENEIVYSFSVEPQDGFTNGVPYSVTLYWIWPRQFEGMIFPGGSESVFSCACAEQTELIAWINSNKNLISNSTDGLDDIDTSSITNAQLLAWSRAYNRGDQLIGSHVAFFNWVIDAGN